MTWRSPERGRRRGRASARAGARGDGATEESGGRREHQEERNLTAVLLVVSPEPGKAGNGGELAWPEARKMARFRRLEPSWLA
jgi:hypothetical protein